LPDGQQRLRADIDRHVLDLTGLGVTVQFPFLLRDDEFFQQVGGADKAGAFIAKRAADLLFAADPGGGDDANARKRFQDRWVVVPSPGGRTSTSLLCSAWAAEQVTPDPLRRTVR
jgi:hypothetical protein